MNSKPPYNVYVHSQVIQREITSNHQGLGTVGNNNRRSRHFCSNGVLCTSFTWYMNKTHVIRVRVIEGPNVRNQIVLCAFHWFSVEVKQILATYMWCMHNNNLKIRIATPLVARNNYNNIHRIKIHYQMLHWNVKKQAQNTVACK